MTTKLFKGYIKLKIAKKEEETITIRIPRDQKILKTDGVFLYINFGCFIETEADNIPLNIKKGEEYVALGWLNKNEPKVNNSEKNKADEMPF